MAKLITRVAGKVFGERGRGYRLDLARLAAKRLTNDEAWRIRCTNANTLIGTLKTALPQGVAARSMAIKPLAFAQNGCVTTSQSIESARHVASYCAIRSGRAAPIPDTPPPGLKNLNEATNCVPPSA